MRRWQRVTPILTALSLSFMAQASPWYPIATGRNWVYHGPGGGLSSATAQSPVSFAGVTVTPIEWDTGPREFYSQDASGRVFAHGLAYPDGSYVVFDPPTLRMDRDLTAGQQWESVTTAILYAPGGGEIRRELGHSVFHVIGIGPVTVAGETFEAAEVLRTEESSLLAGLADSSGSLGENSTKLRLSNTFRDSYAEGVGWILRTDEHGVAVLFALQSYQGGVPTGLVSWGAVKSQFGN